MKLLILGAGRMGIRHAAGALGVENIESIILADIASGALDTAKRELDAYHESNKLIYVLINELSSIKLDCTVAIISATAGSREQLCGFAIQKGCKNILIEKPLGQSKEEVKNLSVFLKNAGVKGFVNLSMRLNRDFIALKSDLKNKSQFQGVKRFTLNSGAVGIGAKGIHYLDFIYFLTEADSSKLIAGDIDEELIPSGRGEQFKDFGGWCVIEFFRAGTLVAKALLSIDASSTVYGGLDIVGKHGRITLNESTGKRVDYLRDENSQMPVQRYNADYQPPSEKDFALPFLGDYTEIWLDGISAGVDLLPSIDESIPVHNLMFDWLSFSRRYSGHYPIT